MYFCVFSVTDPLIGEFFLKRDLQGVSLDQNPDIAVSLFLFQMTLDDWNFAYNKPNQHYFSKLHGWSAPCLRMMYRICEIGLFHIFVKF